MSIGFDSDEIILEKLRERLRRMTDEELIKGAGEAGRQVRHSHTSQREPGAGHCGVADETRGKTEPQARGLVQGLSLPSGQLEDGAASGGEGGVPLRGTVPASRLYRHEPEPAQPGGSALL